MFFPRPLGSKLLLGTHCACPVSWGKMVNKHRSAQLLIQAPEKQVLVAALERLEVGGDPNSLSLPAVNVTKLLSLSQSSEFISPLGGTEYEGEGRT